MRNPYAAFVSVAVFTINLQVHAQWQLQRLNTFTNAQQTPYYILEGRDGNFYGTLLNADRIFKMSPSGVMTIFPPFTSPPITALNSELAVADDGDFYGTTSVSNLFESGIGSIVRITPAGQTTTVYIFHNGPAGGQPSGIRRGIDGSFYGVTDGTNLVAFPPTPYTTIFQFKTNNTLTTLYSFTNATEFTGAPVQGSDGYLYGTTALQIYGQPFSTSYRVSVYRLSTNGDFVNLYTRTNPGTAKELIFGPDGCLYGTIRAGTLSQFQVAAGSIFRITTNGIFTNVFTFNGTNGYDPQARMVLAADGNIYGLTLGGRTSEYYGTIFRVAPDGAFSNVLHFGGTNGEVPLSPLCQARDGNLYGTTQLSESTSQGTIYRLFQPTSFSSFSVSNSVASLSWNSFSNGIYRLECKTSLSDTSWTTLQTITAVNQTVTALDILPFGFQRVYRVTLLP